MIQFLIPFILLLLVQFHLFVIISLIEDNFHKIILNIYFDHTHIMCLDRVFSVHCTDYTLVDNYERNKEGRTKESATKRGIGQELKWKKNDQGTEGYGFGKVQLRL